MTPLRADDLARWQAIRKDGAVIVVTDRDGYYWHKCAECGFERLIGQPAAPMIEHFRTAHASAWKEAQP